MAVVEVFEIPLNAADDNDKDVAAERVFRATVTSASDSPFTVLSHGDIPQAFSEHPENTSLECTKRNITRVSGTRRAWDVRCGYTLKDDQAGGSSNPLNEPIQYAYDTIDVEVALPKDLSDEPKAFATTAGEPFENPPMATRAIGTISIKKNAASFDSYSMWGSYLKTVCKHSFLGWPKDTQLMWRISANSVYSKVLLANYFQVTYEIRVNSDGWKEKRRNQGYRVITEDGDLEEIVDHKQQTLTLPVDINEEGTATLSTGSDPIIREFTMYPSADWYGLGIG